MFNKKLLVLLFAGFCFTINASSIIADDIKKSYRIYGQMNYGYNNNVSSAPDDDYAGLIDLMGKDFDLTDPDELAQYDDLVTKLRKYNNQLHSDYIYPRIGIKANYRLKNKHNIFWGVDISHKEYIAVNDYNTTRGNLALGFNYYLTPAYFLSGTAYYQEYLLDGSRYRKAPIGTMGLSKIFNQSNIVKVYTDIGMLIYPNDRATDNSKLLDVNMYVGGLEWRYFGNKNLLTLRIFYGRNQPRSGAAEYVGKKYYGSTLLFENKTTEKLSLIAQTVYQKSEYDKIQFSEQPALRRDSYGMGSLGFYYSFSKNYTWYVKAIYTNNSSNIGIYEYDRFEALTGINFKF